MRNSGAMRYITPLQSATESSDHAEVGHEDDGRMRGCSGLSADCTAEQKYEYEQKVRQATGGHSLFRCWETLSSLLELEKDAKQQCGFDFGWSSASALH